MNERKINGLQLHNMLLNGLANIAQHEEEINDLNVFPVPDGDTGTNMRLTLENGLKSVKLSQEVGAFLKSLSSGMLMGARGNSGVILSQIFKGFYLELAKCSYIGPGELRNMLITGYKTAYKSVVRPAEGTILTVTREGIENIRRQITRNSTIDEILAMYTAEMKKSLAQTPNLMECLKEAGVVDSGAYGYILIMEGCLKYLYGETLVNKSSTMPDGELAKLNDRTLFNENSSFIDGYCMEFILQLMRGEKYIRTYREASFVEDLKALGNSIVVTTDGMRVKVHIHTLKPAKVIAYVNRYGEFVTFKLENMQIQHNEHIRKLDEKKKKEIPVSERPHKTLATVAVVQGEGMKNIFSEFGCDVVIDGGESMNTSSKEFIDAFNLCNSDAIVVLPNNKNTLLAAQQAVNLSEGKKVYIIPTNNMAEGYYAIASDINDSDDIKMRVKMMNNGLDELNTLSFVTAQKDTVYSGKTCKVGDELCFMNNHLISVSDSRVKAVVDNISHMDDIEDKENCVIFRGLDISDSEMTQIEDELSSKFPMMEVAVLEGGQHLYYLIVALN